MLVDGNIRSAAESGINVVARLYKDHAWQAFAAQPALFGASLANESRASLEKYFAPDLAGLLIADAACTVREKGVCHIDFDLLFDSQDPRVSDLELTNLSQGKILVQFKDPVTNAITRIEFHLVMTQGQWRITDIVYGVHPALSLKKLLAQPLPKG